MSFGQIVGLVSMSVKAKMDKLKRVLSGQEDDDEQNIVTQASDSHYRIALVTK